MVAPLAASLSDKVAFVIQVSGWQGPAWCQDAVRVEAELRAAGFPEADVKEATAFARLRMELIRGTGPFEDLEKAQAKVKRHAWFASVHACDQTLFYSARRNVDYNTEPSWEKVHCPVLVIYGGKDTSSGPPEPLIAVIRRGLKKANNKDVTIRVFPNADHSLCSTKESGRDQAQRAGARQAQNDPGFVSGYLDLMTEWLGKRFPAGS
jgi:pimeloyl-ACP methyl ester carboxylesterase